MYKDKESWASIVGEAGCFVQALVIVITTWLSCLGLLAIVHLMWGDVGVEKWYTVSVFVRVLIAIVLASGAIPLGVVAFFIDLFTTYPLIS